MYHFQKESIKFSIISGQSRNNKLIINPKAKFNAWNNP